MAETAFQPGAFQKNAFQIYGETGSGGSNRKYRRRARKLIRDYQSIVNEFRESKDLISVTDPYIKITTKERAEKRRKAEYLVDAAVDVDEIEWLAMARHEMALELFSKVIAKLKLKLTVLRRKRALLLLLILLGEA